MHCHLCPLILTFNTSTVNELLREPASSKALCSIEDAKQNTEFSVLSNFILPVPI